MESEHQNFQTFSVDKPNVVKMKRVVCPSTSCPSELVHSKSSGWGSKCPERLLIQVSLLLSVTKLVKC